ncbi:hypothetical protein CPAR01_04420 [Colletotrichum paranaense]|uniref:SnoaL-like domain-containing protein n=1 Tax=Colletotrichum paranaense TaxID=1914294 RepID=A0ABQ9SXG3_9PEZI|nr:uncharacterized protein CPAR01_04420 [Colletotrichum paranaense]KAK1543787.1 hypothetical protein CPAR01_04420 [Colletotrichum paranaense]
MSYVTNATDWLSDSITSQAKSLIATFYELADSKVEDAGDRLATEVFSNQATFISPSGTFNGTAEISKCREGAWSSVTSRRHSISKGFAATQRMGTSSKTELVLLGSVHMELVNGKSFDSPFAVHIIMGSSTQRLTEPRIDFLEVFSVSDQFSDRRFIGHILMHFPVGKITASGDSEYGIGILVIGSSAAGDLRYMIDVAGRLG